MNQPKKAVTQLDIFFCELTIHKGYMLNVM